MPVPPSVEDMYRPFSPATTARPCFVALYRPASPRRQSHRWEISLIRPRLAVPLLRREFPAHLLRVGAPRKHGQERVDRLLLAQRAAQLLHALLVVTTTSARGVGRYVSSRSAHATPQQLDRARSHYSRAWRPFNNTAIDRPGLRRLNPVMRN